MRRMVRRRPPEQIHNLLDATELVLCGYGRGDAHMSAVAEEAGVALGTLYHYFTGKDAMLRWAIWRAFDPQLAMPEELPIGPPPGTIENQIAPMLDIPERFPTVHRRPLEGSCGRGDPEPLLRAAVEELYDSIEDGRRRIDLVEAAAFDDDRLADLWFGEMVENLVVVWADFLEELRSVCNLPAMEDAHMSARFVITNCTFFARLRHSGHRSASFPEDDEVRRTTVALIVAALVPSQPTDAAGAT
jgi:AcrR family transcriptional regulator